MKRHIYLSPHSDDAALSCGGAIHGQARRGERPLALTMFGGNPPRMAFSEFAQGQHDKWELEEDAAMALRRQEDAAALRVLGAEAAYLDDLDCIYRLHPQTGAPMYASEEGIFGEIDPAEAEYHLALARRIAALAGPPEPGLTIYAPATAGHHVDHQLACRAACALRREGYRVLLYEDYPYCQKPGELERALAAWPGEGPLRPRLARYGEAAMRVRVAAIAAYRSQIRTLFGDLEAMDRQVRAYCEGLAAGGGAAARAARSRYAERFWAPG
ncbi:MAG: PIG-L family deacetylase [Chloroflexi bacterium]|nr:PIG-L family deacetylase [Chloroflexota bacterium]